MQKLRKQSLPSKPLPGLPVVNGRKLRRPTLLSEVNFSGEFEFDEKAIPAGGTRLIGVSIIRKFEFAGMVNFGWNEELRDPAWYRRAIVVVHRSQPPPSDGLLAPHDIDVKKNCGDQGRHRVSQRPRCIERGHTCEDRRDSQIERVTHIPVWTAHQCCCWRSQDTGHSACQQSCRPNP